ncbi:MAG: helix-turn-helix domain-containing protein [Phycisphaerae bacterium]|nr:helix-turn-helix domain-containing protein [Phycisphaerae bacterium]
MTERLLSVDNVAAFLGVKRDTVYKLIERSESPAFKVGRLWKFRRTDIEMWLEKQAGRRHIDKGERHSDRRGA